MTGINVTPIKEGGVELKTEGTRMVKVRVQKVVDQGD